MYSMTGYGKGVADGSRKVTVEMKSVNHRFLDILFKIPKGMLYAEDVIRRAISEKITRGHIEVFMNYEDLRENRAEISIDKELAKSYRKAAEELKAIGYGDNLGAAEILRLPEIVRVTETRTTKYNKSPRGEGRRGMRRHASRNERRRGRKTDRRPEV
jgi:Uncharacterized stress-induced protein